MKDTDFVYVGQYGFVHVVDEKKTAERNATGKIVEVDAGVIPNEYGYARVDGKDLIVDVDTGEIYIGANRGDAQGQTAFADLPGVFQALLLELGYPKPEDE